MENLNNLNYHDNGIEYVKEDGKIELITPKSGFSAAETTNKMVTDFGCSVCYRVFASPIKTRKCEHHLCHICYVQMRRGIVAERLTRPMTLCPECRSPLESVVRPSPYNLPKVTEVLHKDRAEQSQLEELYNNCQIIEVRENLPIFSETVTSTSDFQFRDVIYAPLRASNTVLNLGIFSGYLTTCVGLSLGAGVVSGILGVGRQAGHIFFQNEPMPPITQAAKNGASWMFNKLSYAYNSIPYESTQLPLPILTYLGLEYLDSKLFQGPANTRYGMQEARERQELYRIISEHVYQVCTPYQTITDSTIAVFRYTAQLFANTDFRTEPVNEQGN